MLHNGKRTRRKIAKKRRTYILRLQGKQKANNPCKGATIRVCGTMTTTYSDMGDNTTRVTRLTTDCDGDVLENWTRTMPFPFDFVTEYPGNDKFFDIGHLGNNDDDDNTGGTPLP